MESLDSLLGEKCRYINGYSALFISSKENSSRCGHDPRVYYCPVPSPVVEGTSVSKVNGGKYLAY